MQWTNSHLFPDMIPHHIPGDALKTYEYPVLYMSDAARLLGLPPVKERKIKIAVGCRCENCQNLFPLPVLEIHAGLEDRSSISCSAESVIVLCPSCHRSLHMHGPEQSWRRLLASQREPVIHNQIIAIIDYRPEPYQAPESPPLSELFEEAIRGSGLDLFQNGA